MPSLRLALSILVLVTCASTLAAQVTFSAPIPISSTLGQEVQGFDTADLDGDGDLDLVAASFSSSQVSWFENTGSGFASTGTSITVAPQVTVVRCGDIDGNGLVDVVIGIRQVGIFDLGEIRLIRNLGGGVFAGAETIGLAPFTRSVELADLDGDGDLDIAHVEGNGGGVRLLAWRENLGSGVFLPLQVVATGLINAGPVRPFDVDEDGDLDLCVLVTSTRQVRFYENLGGGAFAGAVVLTTSGADASDFAFGDLDGDGDAEIVMTSAPLAGVERFENLGGGTFGGATTVATGSFGRVRMADLDGDGALDLVVEDWSADDLVLFSNQGPAGFSPGQVLVTSGGGEPLVEPADVDRDGDIDLVVSAGFVNDELGWHRNDTPFAPDLPGSGDALFLESGVNAAATQRPPTKDAVAGDLIEIRLAVRGGAFLGETTVIVAQVHPVGASILAPAAFPEAWVNPAFAASAPIFVLWDGNDVPLGLGALTVPGVTIGFAIPSLVSAVDVVVQGFALAPSSATGNPLFTTSDAHLLRVTP